MKLPILFCTFVILHTYANLGGESLEIGRNGDDLKPNYTSIRWNVSYRSIGNPQDPYGGLTSTYYKIVELIVDLILPDALPDELWSMQAGETYWSHTKGFIWAYRRLSIFIVILLVQISFLIASNVRVLCSWLFFCSTTAPITGKFKKRLWLGTIQATLLLLLLTLILAHQTNQNMDEGIDTVMLTFDDTLQDVEAFVDTTLQQLEVLLLTNMKDYLKFFLTGGRRTTHYILEDLHGVVDTLDFSKELKDIENSFNFLKPVFDEIEAALKEVEAIGKEINKDIAGLKSLVDGMVCGTKECEKLKNMIPSLDSIYDGGSSAVNDTFAELGKVVDFGKDAAKEIGNLTSMIGGKIAEEGGAIKNLTSNIAGDIMNRFEITGGSLSNLTSNIGGGALEEGKALKNLTANIAGNLINDLKITGGGLSNLTSSIGGGALEEGKALKNLTANIAGNLINELEVTGGGLSNLTSSIGSGALEEGKALKNLTANIAGNLINDLNITGGGLSNLTSSIGGGALEEGKALKNLTANIGGNLINELEVTGGGLSNLTSSIGSGALEEGKALKNLTANIAGDLINDLKITGGGLSNLTSSIGGGALEEGKALKNLTANIAGNLINDLKITGGGLSNLTSSIGGGALEEGKALKNLTANIAGNLINKLEVTGGSLSNLTSSIGGGALEEGKALKNLTANIAGNLINKLEVTGGSLSNLTSSIGGGALEEGKALKNLTANIAGNVMNNLEGAGKGLSNITGKIVGGIGKEIGKEGKALKDVTGKVVGGIGSVAGGLEKKVGGLFGGLGDWTLGSGNNKEKSKDTKTTTTTTSSPSGKTKKKGVLDKVTSGIGSIFGGFAPSSETKNNIKSDNSTTKTEISKFSDNSKNKTESKIDESEIDLTSLLNNGGSNGVKEEVVNINDFSSLLSGLDAYKQNGKTEKSTTVPSIPKTTKTSGGFFGGLKQIASKVSDAVVTGEGKLASAGSALSGSIGSTSNSIKKGVGGFMGGLNVWSTNDQKTTVKKVETTTKSSYGGLFGGLENLASKATNTVEKNSEKIGGLASKVSGGAGGLLGGFGGWTSSGKSQNKVEDKKQKGGFFGFRRKRGVGAGMGNLKQDFDMIFGKIDKIENYVINDLKNLNNLSVLLYPVFEELDGVINMVLSGVENELNEAAKPVEKYFASALDEIISTENSILNVTNAMRDAQEVISWFEVYRFHLSNFIAAALLITFTLLSFGVTLRMSSNNVITKYLYKGGFTLLHLTALLMAFTCLVYITFGVTSKKVLCDTFDISHRESNIMRILSRINPAKYGLLLDLNLHKVIIKCHQDKGLYEVTSLKSVLDIEKMAHSLFDLNSIEKEFEPLVNLNFNFSKFFPLDIINTIGDDLNFGAFDKILDSPVFKQIEKMEAEFTQIPLVGPVIKKITDRIDTFKDKITSMKNHVDSADNGFPSFLTNLKKTLVDIEKGVLDVENKSMSTLHDAVQEFKDLLVSSLMDYVNHLIYSVEHDIGKCKPISAAFNSTLNSVCRRITTPANGHWFSYFVGVFLCIILIVTSRIVDGKLGRFTTISSEQPLTRNSKDVTLPAEIELRAVSGIAVEKVENTSGNEEKPII